MPFLRSDSCETVLNDNTVCEVHLKRILLEARKFVDKVEFMSDVMDDIANITEGRVT